MTEQVQPSPDQPGIISDSLRNAVIRDYLKQVGRKGGLALTKTQRSLAAKRSSVRRWQTRRKLYGPTGYKPKPGWLRAKYPNSFPQDQEESPAIPNP